MGSLSEIQLVNQSCFDYLKTLSDKTVSLFLQTHLTKFQWIQISNQEKLHGVIWIDFVYLWIFGDWDYNFTGLDIVIKECYRILKDGVL